MNTASRCSAEHINEYKNAINKYLRNKAITDFSKYDISFKKDKLTFIKWDYPAVSQPVNITPIPITKDRYIPPKIYTFIVNIGRVPEAHYNPHLFTVHNLDIPGMIADTESNCVIQATACINTEQSHEEMFTSIRNYKCQENKLRVELITVRATKELWYNNVSAHITVFYKPVKLYYSFPK